MRAELLQKTGVRAPGVRQGNWLPARGTILQWGAVIIVSIVLGGVAVSASVLPTKGIPLLLIAVIFPFIAMIVGDVRRLLLAIILLDIPLQLDINLDYQTDAASLGALGGWNLSVTTLCLIGLYTLWMIQLLSKVTTQSRPSLRASLPLVLYLTFVALSVVNAQNVKLALFEVFLLSQMFLLYLYIASTVRTREDVLFIVTMLLIGLTIESLIMIDVYVTGHDLSIGALSTRESSEFVTSRRIGGTLRSPNSAAGYLSLMLTPAVSLLLTPIGHWHKCLAMFAFGLGVVALMLTFSRGGFIAFTLSIMLFSLLTWHRGWLSLSVPFITAVLMGGLILLFKNAVLARAEEGENGRIPLLELAFQIIKDHPVLGIGANNFSITIKQYATPQFNNTWLYIVHNKYLLVWAETGIGGLVAFIVFLVATIRRGWQSWNLHDRLLSPLALGFTVAIIGHIVHLNFDVFNGRSEAQTLWLAAALITAMSKLGHAQTKQAIL